MKVNTSLKAFREGRKTIGGWIAMPGLHSAEVMARSGFDWLVADLQHGLFGISELPQILTAISTTNTTPFVRVTHNNLPEINKVLDMGAEGVVVPMVCTEQLAIDAVNACMYPPRGMRSCGPTRVGQIGSEYLKNANDQVAVICQIETQLALDNAEKIAKVPGNDCLYIGPADLGLALGIEPTGATAEWQLSLYDNPIHQEAVTHTLNAAHSAGKACAMHIVGSGDFSKQLAQRYFDQGFDTVMLGSDKTFLTGGAASAISAAIKSSSA
eukprot:TRINITY_DN19769_c0_g1_i1.p1 TRINITY_DN19769_c0_g1~~TRINITY_DN19769_c0_g1_i1.p1  ORF type:complete len:269 (+),score=57.95 TRINITY_DN19769_c0_g1_i1:51-857(+)